MELTLLIILLLLTTTAYNGLCDTDCTSCISHQQQDRSSLYKEICCQDENIGKVTNLKQVGHSIVILCPPYKLQSCPESLPVTEFQDCKSWLQAGNDTSGIYMINPNGTQFQVYCDMTTSGGGWTVFQRRQSDSINFNRNWTNYENGFGDLQTNFWLGLSNIRHLTQLGSTSLRIDMRRYNGEQYYALYSHFNLTGDRYILTTSGYTGNATDSLAQHNGHNFYTNDRDINDCAAVYKGAWWYFGGGCYQSHLNGVYYNDANHRSYTGLSWQNVGIDFESLKYARMMLRIN